MSESTTNQVPDADEQTQLGLSEKDQAAFAYSCSGDEAYMLGPDSLPQDGVPRGTVTQYHWTSDTIYPGTERDYWLYVPQQYDGSQPACLMVFQDAQVYLGPNINVPVVFDSLIHNGKCLAQPTSALARQVLASARLRSTSTPYVVSKTQ